MPSNGDNRYAKTAEMTKGINILRIENSNQIAAQITNINPIILYVLLLMFVLECFCKKLAGFS